MILILVILVIIIIMVDTGTASVFSTLVLQAIIGFIVYILFELFREQKEIYAPKLRVKPERCPLEPPNHYFGWLKPILNLSDEETLKIVGLDGFMFLRYLKIFTKIGLGCGIFGLITLVPIYGTAPSQEGVVGIAMYTMANITPGGGRLWASLIAYWGFTLLLLYLLYKEYEYFTQLRQNFMKEGDPDISSQQLLTVVVENVPLQYRSSNKLKQFFDELFPGDVYCAKMGLKYESLLVLTEERKKVINALESAIATYESTDRTEPPMIGLKPDGKPVFLYGGEKVEAIPYWEKELARLNKDIEELRISAFELDDLNPAILSEKPEKKDTKKDEEIVKKFTHESMTGTGYVTFQSTRAHAASYQLTSLHDMYPDLKIIPADGPHNIIWGNVSTTISYIKSASSITKCIYIAGLVFWSLIIAFIASVSQISTLEKFLPFLKQLDPVSYSLLQGQLPVIILIVFISLLPLIFKSISTYVEKRKTLTDVDMEVFTWFFCYQLVNVYLLLLAGSVFGALKEILDNPLSIVNLLAESLPTVATFFLNYFITLLLSGVPLLLLRIVPLLIYKLYRMCFNPRKLTLRTLLEGPLADCSVDYSLLIPTIIYPVCIALTYMVIAPILFATAGVYFAATYIAWKYQLCYIVVPSNETGGKFWYKMFSYTMIGLLASNITMIGYMAIKLGIATTILLIPLPFIVYSVWGHCHEKFYLFSCNLSHRQALLKDTNKVVPESESTPSSLNPLIKSFSTQYFIPNVLQSKVSLEEPFPYRVEDTELFDQKTGFINSVYFKGLTLCDDPNNSSSSLENRQNNNINDDDIEKHSPSNEKGNGYAPVSTKSSDVEMKQITVKSKDSSNKMTSF